MARIDLQLNEAEVKKIVIDYYASKGKRVQNVSVRYDRPPNATQFDPGTGLSITVHMEGEI